MVKESITNLARFVEAVGFEAVWVGVDVHKRSYHVALRSESGMREAFVAPSDPGMLASQLIHLGLRIALVVYEAGPTGFGLARALEAKGLPVFVVAPSKILRPVRPGAKTDRLDCLKLAEFAAKGLAKPIAVPSQEEEADRSLIRRRHQVVDDLRRSKQRIKSLLLCNGAAEPPGLATWSKRSIARLERISLPGRAKGSLMSMVRELRFEAKELARIDQELKRLAGLKRHRARVAAVRSVPGVGPVTAMAFCLEIFRPCRFKRPEEIAGYLGLAPMVRHSGEGKKRGRIVPTGQKRLRSFLIEAAWSWKRYDPAAKEFYNRILARCGVPQKAITALARKLAIVMWRLCLEQRAFSSTAVNV